MCSGDNAFFLFRTNQSPDGSNQPFHNQRVPLTVSRSRPCNARCFGIFCGTSNLASAKAAWPPKQASTNFAFVALAFPPSPPPSFKNKARRNIREKTPFLLFSWKQCHHFRFHFFLQKSRHLMRLLRHKRRPQAPHRPPFFGVLALLLFCHRCIITPVSLAAIRIWGAAS